MCGRDRYKIERSEMHVQTKQSQRGSKRVKEGQRGPLAACGSASRVWGLTVCFCRDLGYTTVAGSINALANLNGLAYLSHAVWLVLACALPCEEHRRCSFLQVLL